MATIEERTAMGKHLRSAVPRSSHRNFVRDASLDPVDLVLSQESGRIESLIPVRRSRMGENAFAFFRAGALLMASDLAGTPRTNVMVQASGDAHLANFGWYGSPERDLVFDVNDFDESTVGAWEWDVKRLAASFVIAGRDNEFRKKDQRHAARAATRSYQKAIRYFAKRSVLEVWYAHISADDILDKLEAENRAKDLRKMEKEFHKTEKKDSRHVLGKLAKMTEDGYRIVDNPPFVVPLRSEEFPIDVSEVNALIAETLDSYLETVSPSVGVLMRKFHVVDVALKVVGVGSVGTRCFIVMLEGTAPDDVLFLQLKEAGRSVLEREFGDSSYPHSGQRVVEGQRLMQTVSDIMLGWTTTSSQTQYYVRQLKDMKASIEIGELDPDDLRQYAEVCGWMLGRAHARSGDPAIIAGYIGKNDTFAHAVTRFAVSYANQNERDYKAFIERMRTDGAQPAA